MIRVTVTDEDSGRVVALHEFSTPGELAAFMDGLDLGVRDVALAVEHLSAPAPEETCYAVGGARHPRALDDTCNCPDHRYMS